MRWLICLPILAVFRAAAHPGHSPLEQGVSHVLASPDHFLPFLAGGVILFVIGRLLKHRASSLLLTWTGTGTAIAGATGWLVSP